MAEKDAAWNDDLLRDPHHVADKRSRVQKMFSAIAPKYDLNNRLHSFGMDQRWRKKAVRLSLLKASDFVIDIACGTGDLTIQFAEQLYGLPEFDEQPHILGIDFTFAMLPIASGKWSNHGIVRHTVEDPDSNPGSGEFVAFLNADATALPLPETSADIVSIAFGIRNVQEPAKALAEFYRILRPGGRVIILEFSQPKNRIIRFFNNLYCSKIMPHTATWVSGDKSGAYKYLPKSVETFMSRETMKSMMRDAGFVDVTEHPMTFGVCVCYRGYKR